MTENTALAQAPQSGLPSIQAWQMIVSMGQTLVASKMLPEAIKTPEAAAAIILKGYELGIPAMQSFSHIHVIKGKPTCSSELQLALLARGGVTWGWKVSTNDAAIIEFRRPGFDACLGEFTIDQAKAAGLLSNQTWKSYPANMMRARAISNGARMIGADLLAGMSYTPEEMGAGVDAAGTPVEVEAEVAPLHHLSEVVDGTPADDPPWVRFRKRCGELKEEMGAEEYYMVLNAEFGIEKCSEVPQEDIEMMRGVVEMLEAQAAVPEDVPA